MTRSKSGNTIAIATIAAVIPTLNATLTNAFVRSFCAANTADTLEKVLSPPLGGAESFESPSFGRPSRAAEDDRRPAAPRSLSVEELLVVPLAPSWRPREE